jgi:hypothetical protein
MGELSCLFLDLDIRFLDLDIRAATAALTMPFHNGRTEGVDTMKDENESKGKCADERDSPSSATASWSDNGTSPPEVRRSR